MPVWVTSCQETSCPGNVCPGKCLSGKHLSRKVRKTVKKKINGTLKQLKGYYTEQILRLKPHVYTIVTQYEVLTAKKEELQANEVMIHIDFSENWTVKTLSAVQSAHFDVSLEQISLHTGLA